MNEIIAVLESLVGDDVCYDGSFIRIQADSHSDAMHRVRKARELLDTLKKDTTS